MRGSKPRSVMEAALATLTAAVAPRKKSSAVEEMLATPTGKARHHKIPATESVAVSVMDVC